MVLIIRVNKGDREGERGGTAGLCTRGDELHEQLARYLLMVLWDLGVNGIN